MLKICRLKVTDDLRYEHKFYDDKPSNDDLITWEELYHLHEEEILAKEKESLDKIQEFVSEYPDHKVVCGTSTGKDSRLVEHLLNKAGVDYFLFFNDTTCDSADTYKEVKKQNIPMIRNKDKNGNTLKFYKEVRNKGVPTRTYRWCCTAFKEESSTSYFIDEQKMLWIFGMRNDESTKRANYDWKWYNDATWPKNKSWHGLLPIRKWLELELWLYIVHNNLPINPIYKKGYNRVGCDIVCPYAKKSSWILDKYWSPSKYERWMKIVRQDFINKDRWTIKNCTLDESVTKWNDPTPFTREERPEVIKEFMQYKGIDDYELAKKYFNKKCIDCGKTAWQKDCIAMNLKMFGRNIDQFRCKNCLMKELGWKRVDWNGHVEKFKQQECVLF
jgi:3'-phosphoadenosine 5'-phosphosulfate sulfotransferase (PAPS reductase)/FAD synthetase